MNVLFLLGLHLLAASLAGAITNAANSKTKFVLPFEVGDGESTVQAVSVDGGLDLPKLTPGVNDTTFEWWYFDAISSTTNESFTIAFYSFGPSTLEVPNMGGALVVQVTGTLIDGTTFFKSMAATRNASFLVNDNGIIASHWDGDGGNYLFSGSNHDGPNITYTLSGDDPDTDSFGTVVLKSVSPSRYPCDANDPGVTEQLMPNVYWSNAVPDSEAVVRLTIAGHPLNFEGYGYHDQKWGVNRLNESVKSWYWGHGRLGPYSIVWFDALDQDGKEYFSSWISLSSWIPMNGTVLLQSCNEKSVVVRPWMKDGTDPVYPPNPKDPAPDGYDIRFDRGDGQTFLARFHTNRVQFATDTYKRITGHLEGGFQGGKKYEGMAICEQVQN